VGTVFLGFFFGFVLFFHGKKLERKIYLEWAFFGVYIEEIKGFIYWLNSSFFKEKKV